MSMGIRAPGTPSAGYGEPVAGPLPNGAAPQHGLWDLSVFFAGFMQGYPGLQSSDELGSFALLRCSTPGCRSGAHPESGPARRSSGSAGRVVPLRCRRTTQPLVPDCARLLRISPLPPGQVQHLVSVGRIGLVLNGLLRWGLPDRSCPFEAARLRDLSALRRARIYLQGLLEVSDCVVQISAPREGLTHIVVCIGIAGTELESLLYWMIASAPLPVSAKATPGCYLPEPHWD